MAGQPCEINTKGYARSPKGKLPFIDDAGAVVADSTFIRWHLEKKYGIDFDKGLSAEQRAIAWATEKMLEDNLYWIGLYWRWMDDAAFAKVSAALFGAIPWPMRKLVGAIVRRGMRKSLHGQGMGRHRVEEMSAIGRRGIESLSALLGDKPYLVGSEPCSTDAMMFATLTSALCPQFDNPLRQDVARYPNLVAYEARMRQRYFAA
jgi:glutathione S-transferase